LSHVMVQCKDSDNQIGAKKDDRKATPDALARQLFEHLADVHGDARELARLCNAILSRSLAGEKGSSFYKDVDEAISLSRALAEDEDSPRGEAALREIERRMKRIKNRRNRG
jgi:hypothetical protein